MPENSQNPVKARLTQANPRPAISVQLPESQSLITPRRVLPTSPYTPKTPKKFKTALPTRQVTDSNSPAPKIKNPSNPTNPPNTSPHKSRRDGARRLPGQHSPLPTPRLVGEVAVISRIGGVGLLAKMWIVPLGGAGLHQRRIGHNRAVARIPRGYTSMNTA